MRTMKKAVLLMMTMACVAGNGVLAYGAPAKAATGTVKETAKKSAAEAENFAFTYGENRYELGMEAEAAMKTLGKETSSRDVNNCANGYVNKAYMYGDKDFEVYVEQSGKKEIVANITLLTSAVATEEGLKPGDEADQVTKLYKDAKKGLGSYTASKGDTKLYIKVKDGKVSYISYMTEK